MDGLKSTVNHPNYKTAVISNSNILGSILYFNFLLIVFLPSILLYKQNDPLILEFLALWPFCHWKTLFSSLFY